MSYRDTAGATARGRAAIGVWAGEKAVLAQVQNSLNVFMGF